MYRICVVEDETVIREGLKCILTDAFGDQAAIFGAEDGVRCMDILLEKDIQVIITDIRMPQMDGLRLMELASEARAGTRFLVLSGYDDFQYCKRAMRFGAVDYLLKPVDEAELVAAVGKVLAAISDRGDGFDGQEAKTGHPDEYSKLMTQILDHIKRHYALGISLNSLSEAFHYNPKYLSQLFKKETGVNFIDYLNRVRIQRAKQFLRQDGARVEEVAFRVGFQNPKYFAKLFKDSEGMTPTEYRKK